MTAQQLKNSILQMAVQGKLVPQDPSDEPASVLLQRIKAEKQELIKAGKIKKSKKSSEIFRGASRNLPYAFCEQICFSRTLRLHKNTYFTAYSNAESDLNVLAEV